MVSLTVYACILKDGAYAHLAASDKKTACHGIVGLASCLPPDPWMQSSCLDGRFVQEGPSPTWTRAKRSPAL